MDSTTRSTEHTMVNPHRNERRTTGVVMIGLGLFFFITQWVNFGVWSLLLLGVSFTVWGIISRSAGPLIPGGILNGIAIGALLSESGLAQLIGGEARGGLFLLGFALGWLSVEVLSRLFTSDIQRWVRLPGGVLAVIGALVLAQEPGLQVLRLIGVFWPVALVVAGVGLLLRWWRTPEF
jgi:hypothetical protein